MPNQAFLHARADDKFWAAQKLAALTTDLIRAAVRSGEFGDPAAEEFLVRALAEPRDAIARAYLTPVNPIADAGARRRRARSRSATRRSTPTSRAAPAGYRARWSTYDNAIGEGASLGETTAREPRLPIATGLPRADGAFIKVELSAFGGTHPAWAAPVSAYFRLRGGNWKLVGFERTSGGH